MNKITENKIELFAIELLESQGYNYIYAPDIAPDSDTSMLSSFEEVLIRDKILSALQKLNQPLDYDLIEEACKQIECIKSSDLLTDNEAFVTKLLEAQKYC